METEIQITQELIESQSRHRQSCNSCAIGMALRDQLNYPRESFKVTMTELITYSNNEDNPLEEDMTEQYMSDELVKWHHCYVDSGLADPITLVFADDIIYIKELERYDYSNGNIIPLN